MRINRISPSFKGFIYSPDDKVAVNTKHITAMREEETSDGKKTIIFSTDRTFNTINAPLEQVLKTYNRASASEMYYINVKDYAPKDTKKPHYTI